MDLLWTVGRVAVALVICVVVVYVVDAIANPLLLAWYGRPKDKSLVHKLYFASAVLGLLSGPAAAILFLWWTGHG